LRHHAARVPVSDTDTNYFSLVCAFAPFLASSRRAETRTRQTTKVEHTTMIGKYRGWWLGVALMTGLSGGVAQAGDSQIGIRMGKVWLKVDGQSMSSGDPVDESLRSIGFTFSHRWDGGAYVQVGIGGATNFDIFSFDSVDHQWVAGGWQFDLPDEWKFTPKLGMAYSSLEAEDEDLFDDEPVNRINETILFAELAIERRIGRHFGAALFFRENFETWGSSRGWGLSLNWTW
jgi:hypothetical protein